MQEFKPFKAGKGKRFTIMVTTNHSCYRISSLFDHTVRPRMM